MAKVEYVVASGKHHRTDKDGVLQTFRAGDKIEPTTDELKKFPDRFKQLVQETTTPAEEEALEAAAQAAALNSAAATQKSVTTAGPVAPVAAQPKK